MIRRIPRGKVASYGQLAALAGDARQARQVAWILHAAPEAEGLPWHRVINARGRVSLPGSGGRAQIRRLRAEGIRVGPGGSVDMIKFGWKARSAAIKKPPLSDRELDRL
jgi:methylated-DNA-protein-cysteine methyltransferase-like protein